MIAYEVFKDNYVIVKNTWPITFWAESYCGYVEDYRKAGIYSAESLDYVSENQKSFAVIKDPNNYDFALKNLIYFAIPVEDIKLFLHLLKGFKKYGRAK